MSLIGGQLAYGRVSVDGTALDAVVAAGRQVAPRGRTQPCTPRPKPTLPNSTAEEEKSGPPGRLARLRIRRNRSCSGRSFASSPTP